MNLRDRIAVVTGAASGIGRAICRQLAENGVRAIAAVDVSEAVHLASSTVNHEIGRSAVIPFHGDVTDASFRKGVFAAMKHEFGVVNICVPAAGIVRDGLAVKIDKSTGEARLYDQTLFERTVQVNLIAPVYWALETIASVAVDRFKKGLGRWDPSEGQQGAVIFVGSISSAGNRGQISYASTKAALQGAQSTLSREAIYHGVRCAIVHPGFTDTPMVRAMDQRIIQDTVLPNTQLRRLLQPEEIADAVVFLIRNAAVSGAVWADAGWRAPV